MSFSLIPNIICNRTTEITPEQLEKKQIRLLMMDFDNTIVPYTCDEPTAEMRNWLSLMKHSDVTICVVSNSRNGRVVQFCRDWDIPCVTRAKKPFQRGIREALVRFSCKPQQAAIVGDQIFTDTLGGNLAGVTTILVKPIHLHNIFLKLRNYLEQPFILIGRKRIDHEKS